jgi:hypothetical protein
MSLHSRHRGSQIRGRATGRLIQTGPLPSRARIAGTTHCRDVCDAPPRGGGVRQRSRARMFALEAKRDPVLGEGLADRLNAAPAPA